MKCLFIVMDTVRRDFLEAYGNDWVKTPNLARLARRGVTFDSHCVGSMPCMPARREFLTGRYNFIDRGWGPIEPFDDVLPRELRKSGAFTHLLTDHGHYFELGGENYHTAYDTWEFFRGQEFDPWISRVDAPAIPETLHRRLSKQSWLNHTHQRAEEDFSGPRTARAAVDWLHENRDASGDWFLQVEIFDPHEPFHCTDQYREMYNDNWDGPLYDWPLYGLLNDDPEAIEHIRKCYAGLLTMTDFWIGKVLDALDETGQWDDTLIVFTTDHGTMLSEHGFWMKSPMPVYDEVAHIPLIMKLPGGEKAGQRVSGFSQTIDLMPTFLEFFGCNPPPHVQGQSLRPVLEGGRGREDGLFGYFGMATNYTDGHYVYMRNPVNDDGRPLNAYTSMSVGGLNAWYPRSLHGQMEMGRYFSHTYDMPLYKIPVGGKAPIDSDGQSFAGRHQLFDMQADPQQRSPLELPCAAEQRCVSRMRELLEECEAPPEQFTRLGLEPGAGTRPTS
jgi:arylsulfatase A-like enzyme